MKTGIIDVGGGFRDVYGAGILDVCLEKGIVFDYALGISAGSANLTSYLSGQKGRNHTFYMEYVFRKAYASPENWLRTRNYVDLDYVYGTLSASNGENPLDYEAFARSRTAFLVGACDARTGKAVYFDRSHIHKDCYDVCKASSALPLFCKPYVIDGVPYYDGGLCDPIPVDKALADGCERVVLILTRPLDALRDPKSDRRIAAFLKRHYPEAGKALQNRAKAYNDGVARAKELAAQGKVLILAPDDVCGLTTLKKDREKMQLLYEKGVRDAQAIEAFLAR